MVWMYRLVRTWHRWTGLVAALFLIVISLTGFLLSTKGSFGWVRPPEKDGAEIATLSEVVSLDMAAQAAFDLGIGDLQKREDIDRIDYRPGSNVFKIVSEKGYHEVQVDGKTGEVLQVARRIDQLTEDIHDLSFFGDWLKDYGLPVVACLLLILSISGLGVFGTPVVRRWQFARKRNQTQ